MNDRFNTDDLAERLARQTKLDKESAQKFISTISDFVINGIETNKSVKVSNLGTFKVMLVRERESVHIQTGERFIIPAHHKLSFIPDKEMKENINKPFAYLEPVEAGELSLGKDIVDIDDEEYAEDVEDTSVENTVTQTIPELEEDIVVPEASFNPDIADIQEDDIEIKQEYYDIISPVISINRSSRKYTTETTDNVFEAGPKSNSNSAVPEQEGDDSRRKVNSDDKKNKNIFILKKIPLWAWFIVLPLLIVIGVGIGTYAFLQFSMPSGNTYTNLGEVTSITMDGDANIQEPLPLGATFLPDSGLLSDNIPDTTQQQEITGDTVAVVNNTDSTIQPIDWLSPPGVAERKEEPKRAEKPNKEIERKNRELLEKQKKAEEAKKTVTSSAQTTKVIPKQVRISQGSSLRDIAREYFGDKVFWVYIYEYNKNVISNYDKIPAGTELRLPSPKSYGIDSKSQESVEKAYQIQVELYKRDRWDDYRQ
jgi:nucleoid DNA-binding protein